jgi:hypothetical protein
MLAIPNKVLVTLITAVALLRVEVYIADQQKIGILVAV